MTTQNDRCSPTTGRWGGSTVIHMSTILREGFTTMRWQGISSAARNLRQGKTLNICTMWSM